MSDIDELQEFANDLSDTYTEKPYQNRNQLLILKTDIIESLKIELILKFEIYELNFYIILYHLLR